MQLVLAIVFACAVFASPLLAEDHSDAARRVLGSVDRVIDILKSGDYKDPAQKTALREELEPVVRDIFDFRELSMRTVGLSWRKFTPEQQDAFAEAFAQLLAETYLDRIQNYSDEKVVYLDERTNKKGNVEVQTKVVGDGIEIPIFYRMKLKDDWVIYDVIVEGVSLVKNYRTQFKEILINKTPDDLIAMVEKKVAKKRAKDEAPTPEPQTEPDTMAKENAS